MNPAININKSTTTRTQDKVENAEPVAKKRNIVQQIIFNYRAKGEVKKTLKAIDQAKQIRQGKKPTKSFEQSIKEL
jgi:hypothetical protein